MIEGVKVKKLRRIEDDRGFLMEMLRSDDELFEKFGQVYMTMCKPNVAKAWHYHTKQTDHFVVVHGIARVALYDMREKSKTKGEVNEFIMTLSNPILLKIPPHVAHGFTAEGDEPCHIVNIPTEKYNHEKPDEFRIPFNTRDIPYDWRVSKGG